MPALPIDRLIFKGTHNSYDARRRNALSAQIDDFGVWAVELDYSIAATGPPRAIVGHDGPGMAADGEDVIDGDPKADTPEDRFRLEHFFERIKAARAFAHRPLILYLEKKIWRLVIPNGIGGVPVIRRLDNPAFDVPDRFLTIVEAHLHAAFPNRVFGPARLAERGGPYPSVPELAGHVIPVAINAPGPDPVNGNDSIFHDGPCEGPCRSFNIRGGLAEKCDGLDRVGSVLQEGNRVVRVDNYQADRSFDFGVPPNPIVVREGAARETPTQGCDGSLLRVHQQGTFLFPYDSIERAVVRAGGSTPSAPVADSSRAAFGWTVLIGPGLYRESVTIDIPLTLRKDEAVPGDVVIDREP